METTETTLQENGFLGLGKNASPEKVVLMLEEHVEENKTVDNKAYNAITIQKGFTGEHLKRIYESAIKGALWRIKKGHPGFALAYLKVAAYADDQIQTRK